MNSTKNALIVLLAVVAIGSGALAWRQYQELVELRAAAMNVKERAELQKKLWDLQKANRQLEDQLAALQGVGGDDLPGDQAGRERPAGNDVAFGRDGGRGRGGQQFAAIREALAKPEVQAMMASARTALLDTQYAALFRNLNLSPEQADKLKALLLERQNSLQDVMSAARDQGIDPRSDREGFRKLVTDAQNAVNDSIKSLLGENGFTQFTNFEQTLPQRNVVNALQQRLSYSDAPLSAPQAEQLVQILATNSPSQTNAGSSSGSTPDGPGFGFRGGGDFGARLGGMGASGAAGAGLAAAIGPGSAPITAQAVAQAQTVLAPYQLTALQQLQQQQQTARQLEQVMRSAASPPASSGGQTGANPSPATRKRPGG